MTSSSYHNSLNKYNRSIHLSQTRTKINSKDVITEPVSLEVFNKVESDLNTKGIINLKNTIDI